MGLNKQIYKPSSVHKHFTCLPVTIYLVPPLLAKSKRPYPSRHRYADRSELLLIRDLFGLAPRRDCPFHPNLQSKFGIEAALKDASKCKHLSCRNTFKVLQRLLFVASSGSNFASQNLTRLCCSYPLLSEDGCYPLRCSAELGLSSHPPREENPEGEERLPNLLV